MPAPAPVASVPQPSSVANLQPAPEPVVAPTWPSGGRLHSQTAQVLQLEDHGLWIAGIDDLIMPHPRAQDLLELLDEMMFIAAHKEGNPFTLPRLDLSEQAQDTLSPVRIDDGFDDVPPRVLPPTDHANWRIELGQQFQPMPAATLRRPAKSILKEKPAPLIFDEDEIFLAGPALVLPDADGAVWLISEGQMATPLPALQAQPLPRIATS